MKKIRETEGYEVYQCEKCGCRQIIYKNTMNTPSACIAVDCEDYGYNEEIMEVAELREKYIEAQLKTKIHG